MMRMADFYPDGYPIGEGRRCHDYNKMIGATCIIDNAHVGRPHFGPDQTGAYRQWTNLSSLSVSSGSSLSSPIGH